MDGLVHVRAGELFEALTVVVGVKRRRVPLKRAVVISIDYEPARRELTISEPRYGVRRQGIPAEGVWADRVQVDGERLRVLAGKYLPEDGLGLMVTAAELTLVRGASRIVLPRTDYRRKPVEERPLPPARGHKGKPYQAPDPVGKKVALGDTWLFSARVPMPQHREGKKRS